jgi:DNA-nicking Smr family endonuclease
LSKKDKLSEQDKKDWKNFLDNPLSFFEKENLEKEHSKRPKRFKFDLHGFSIENANKKVNEIINQCCQEGFSEILFITGKGLHSNIGDSVYVSKEYNQLKNTVLDFIKNSPDLNSKIIKITKANEKLGGGGALIVKLKKLQNKF